MKAAFLTEREALDFISSEFGENAELTRTSITNGNNLDLDEIPFPWDGELAAYEVAGTDAFVGFWEPLGASYTVEFLGTKVTTDSLYRAREIAEKMEELAEDINAAGTISITDADGEVCDETEVEIYDEDEPAADAEKFANAWRRMIIGDTIRKRRIAMGYNLREFAAKTGLSKNNICRIESGDYNYTIDNLNAIARTLGIELSLD